MNIKKPEQIADATIKQYPMAYLSSAGYGRYRTALIAAIEADRAQRSAGVEYWARDVADAMFEDKSNDWLEELTELRVILDEPEGWLDA